MTEHPKPPEAGFLSQVPNYRSVFAHVQVGNNSLAADGNLSMGKMRVKLTWLVDPLDNFAAE